MSTTVDEREKKEIRAYGILVPGEELVGAGARSAHLKPDL
jgi:hypothetical protein